MGTQIADGKVDAAAHMLQQGDLGAGHIVKGGGMLQDGEIAGFLDVGADGTDDPAEVQALEKISVRSLIMLMNFLLWFGNTTILLMADIMGIDQTLFDAAQIDGASSVQVFFRVTLPLLMPILIYTIITAMIGGLQMFDVPQILTNGGGTPNGTSMTLIMYLNNYLKTSKNYGMSGAISVIIFIITGILSLFVYRSLTRKED